MQQSTGHSITTTHNQVVRLHSRDRNASVCGSNYSCFRIILLLSDDDDDKYLSGAYDDDVMEDKGNNDD
jgi:hypothetical protein